MAKNITPREKDYSKWYHDIIKAAQLADHSPVRGCMVVQPNGWSLWEAIQEDLDQRFKDTGHVNAQFPLLIPLSFLAKEAQHVEGFAMECAVVTHSGLSYDKEAKDFVVRNQLEEPYIIRPTSETVIGHMYAQWIQSWRDLPILVNQWANVMRWEMRTRLFLRTSEFFWQEGHTAHETAEEAEAETLRMLDVYASFAEDFLAIPVLKGEKTARERFAGAEQTYCIEALMQDGKALQAGTSHNLGQNFSKAFQMSFEGRDQKREFAWTTSWGVSTRLIGALIMVHSDDEGLVLPPKVAPTLAVIIPIFRSEEEKAQVLEHAMKIATQLCGEEEVRKAQTRLGQREFMKIFLNNPKTNQCIVIDQREELRPGEKHFYWEQRGIPLRFELGPREVHENKIVIKSRLTRDKKIIEQNTLSTEWLQEQLTDFQNQLYQRAKQNREAKTLSAESADELFQLLNERAGFIRCFMEDNEKIEEEVKKKTKGTVRLIYPQADMRAPSGKCIFSGKEVQREVVFAQAY